METTQVMVLGQLLTLFAEIEAMKIDNKQRELQGQHNFNFDHDAFMSKAEEARNITNQLFK